MEKENKIIAEFMGLKDGTKYLSPSLQEPESIGLGTYVDADEMRYHQSWDWLMPVVVECFERFGNTDTIDYMKLNDALLTCNIEELYKAVVEFIEWHSQQQKDYNARIKWLDTGDIRDVIITTKEVGEDDDQIFFYFESESEIKEFMKEGKNEFIILEYSSFDKS